MARRRPITLLLAVAVAALVGACSDEEPQGFTADNQSGFLAACSQPLEDTRLVSEICQCVFDETQARISFDRFAAADAALVEQPEQRLPSEITQIIAECVIDEGDL